MNTVVLHETAHRHAGIRMHLGEDYCESFPVVLIPLRKEQTGETERQKLGEIASLGLVSIFCQNHYNAHCYMHHKILPSTVSSQTHAQPYRARCGSCSE